MDKRILTHLVLLTLIISCSKGKPHQTPHPDQGAVVVKLMFGASYSHETADANKEHTARTIKNRFIISVVC